MANSEAQTYCEFYYEKGRKDYLSGSYNQPFPFPTSGVLDNFEKEVFDGITLNEVLHERGGV